MFVSNGWDASTIGRRPRMIVTVLILAISLIASAALAQDSKPGKITGKVVFEDDGEPVFGANVAVVGTSIGAITDFDGAYVINNVAPGTYLIRISSVEINQLEIADVVVESGEVQTLNIPVPRKDAEELEVVIKVTAKQIKNSVASTIALRQEASSVVDAISSEEMSKAGAGDASEAVTKTVGASKTSDDIFVRGLGDRYVQKQLNGRAMPSADAWKQSSEMELIPVDFLDNIQITKTATPDKAGSFSGGIVNTKLKDYPEKLTLSVGTSVSHNSVTTGENVLTHERSGTEWIAQANGYYDYPSIIDADQQLMDDLYNQPFSSIYVRNSRPEDTVLVNGRLAVNDGFRQEMSPSTRTAPLNQGYSITFGNEFRPFGARLGILTNWNWSRKFSTKNGLAAQYKYGGTEYQAINEFEAEEATDENAWNGMFTANLGLWKSHKLSWNYVRSQTSENTSLQYWGYAPEYGNGDKVRDIALTYKERKLLSNEVSGEHSFLKNFARVNWSISGSTAEEDDPDTRLFVDEANFLDIDTLSPGYEDTTWVIDRNQFAQPRRYHGERRTDNMDRSIDLQLQFSPTFKFKTGFSYLHEEAEQRARRFEYALTTAYNDVDNPYNGDIEWFATQMGIDRVDTTSGGVRYYFQNYFRINDSADNAQFNYDGYRKIPAAFGMLDFQMPFIPRLDVVAGVRWEKTDMSVMTWNGRLGEMVEEDLLPSVNLTYHLTDATNLRASYGQTLARPAIRELSPSPDYVSGTSYQSLGNDSLQISRIDNYDLRLEWFPRPGEVFAASVFYKWFEDPIEWAIFGPNGDRRPENAPYAKSWGVELEFRTRLDFVRPWMERLTVGGNFTYVRAKMGLNEFEAETLLLRWADTQVERDMYGQSPFLMNLDASYDVIESGLSISMHYNVFGQRLAFNSNGINPDIYEMPFHQLDLTASKTIFGNAKLKLKVRNLLNDKIEYKYIDYLAPEEDRLGKQLAEQYDVGVTYSIGVTYNIF